MIQANELRIGNYIYDVGGQPSKVVRLTEEKIPLASPIPLTTEILEKAGFNRWPTYPERIDRHGFKYFSYTIKGVEFKSAVLIEYLHQLQNLYFALTGEELPIEL